VTLPAVVVAPTSQAPPATTMPASESLLHPDPPAIGVL